jgi:putative ABC transport system permease protein
MGLLVTLRVALRALMRNKVRSMLTILGIIIGIAAVIAVVAVGQGVSKTIQSQISSMGNNIVLVFPGSATRGGLHFGHGTRSTLTAEDAEAIASECRHAKAVSPVVRGGGQIVYMEKNWQTGVQGVGTAFLEIRNWQIAEGNFFSDSDVRSAAKVCVIGATIEKEVFAGDEAVGKTIRLKNVPLRIIGVLEKKGSAAWGQDQDDIMLVPWTTMRRSIQASPFTDVNNIVVSAVSANALEAAKTDIANILRQRHRLAPGVEDDFSVSDMTEMTEMITETSRVMTMLLAVIASISLLVGGIGIMNIMLVSVRERTREIGLRMAVGAGGRDILMQFLVEAVVLAGIGGVFGIALGAGAALVIARTNSWPVLVAPEAVLVAFLFSAGVGVFFGFYPAWRASRLDPIEALRYE